MDYNKVVASRMNIANLYFDLKREIDMEDDLFKLMALKNRYELLMGMLNGKIMEYPYEEIKAISEVDDLEAPRLTR